MGMPIYLRSFVDYFFYIRFWHWKLATFRGVELVQDHELEGGRTLSVERIHDLDFRLVSNDTPVAAHSKDFIFYNLFVNANLILNLAGSYSFSKKKQINYDSYLFLSHCKQLNLKIYLDPQSPLHFCHYLFYHQLNILNIFHRFLQQYKTRLIHAQYRQILIYSIKFNCYFQQSKVLLANHQSQLFLKPSSPTALLRSQLAVLLIQLLCSHRILGQTLIYPILLSLHRVSYSFSIDLLALPFQLSFTMSKPNNNDYDDDDDDFIEDEDISQNGAAPFGKDNIHPNSSDKIPSFGSVGNRPFMSNPHSFDSKFSSFGDVNMSMGPMFGAGHDRFGSSFMGMRYGDHHHHPQHSSDLNLQSDFMKPFDTDFFGNPTKKKPAQKKQEQKKEPEQSEKERLARLAKKIDLPEEQQVTLVDWAVRGPLEVVRLVLEYILIPYKERKYVFKTKDQWYNVDRAKLLQKHPEIELPYLEDGEKIVCGTEAMIIYILNKYKRTELLGSTVEEKVRLATASSLYWQVLEDYYELVYGEYDENLSWQRARDKYTHQRFIPKLNKLVTFLKSKNFPSSAQFTWIDFALAETVTILNEMDGRFKEQTMFIQNFLGKLFELPQFIVYRQSYRFHERPYNGFGAIYK